jgi:hypothetical protein
MNYLKDRYLLVLQALALLGGSIVGWVTIIREVDYFCEVQGTGLSGLTSFSGTLTTNPIATPCFWGSIFFLIALGWTIYLLFVSDSQKTLWHQTRLVWLLVGSTLFAAANNVYTFYKYYSNNSGTDHFGCPANKIENPFMTACFAGGVAFLLALIFGYLYLKRLRSKS